MTPLRNGVVADLAEYGCCVRTDIYMLNGVLILRTTAQKLYQVLTPDIVISRIEHWFDEHDNYGTMIVLPGDWTGRPSQSR